MLTAEAGHRLAEHEEMYGDFVLRLEWRVPENGNSGVFIRVPDLKTGQQPHVAGNRDPGARRRGPQYNGKLKP